MRQFSRVGEADLVTAVAVLLELNRMKIGTTLIGLMAIVATKFRWLASGSKKRRIEVTVMTEFDGRLIERLFRFPSDVRALRAIVSRSHLEMAFLTPDREFGVLTKSHKLQLKQLGRHLVMDITVAFSTVRIRDMSQGSNAAMFRVAASASNLVKLRFE